MRGLPDSAVVGTYKRLHRKPKRKSYQAEVDSIYYIIQAIQKFNARHARNKK